MVRENIEPFRSGNILIHGLICCKHGCGYIYKIAYNAINNKERPNYLSRSNCSSNLSTGLDEPVKLKFTCLEIGRYISTFRKSSAKNNKNFGSTFFKGGFFKGGFFKRWIYIYIYIVWQSIIILDIQKVKLKTKIIKRVIFVYLIVQHYLLSNKKLQSCFYKCYS